MTERPDEVAHEFPPEDDAFRRRDELAVLIWAFHPPANVNVCLASEFFLRNLDER